MAADRADTKPAATILDADAILLHDKFQEIKKMSKVELLAELEMWRNLWQWTPNEVKYYIVRVGQQIGVTMRNNKRYLGTLLETHWTIDELEIGTYDKVYDLVDGQYYFERKIVKMRPSGLNDIQWIKERTKETDIIQEEADKLKTEAELQEQSTVVQENAESLDT